MYFYRLKGKQYLDLKGTLVLTHNEEIVATRSKSAGPTAVYNARYVENLAARSRRDKVRASWAALRFIWGKSTALGTESVGGGRCG
jgi:hypothetical protein